VPVAAAVASRADSALAAASESARSAAAATGTGKGAKRKTSRARPVDSQLTDEVRKALASWAEQNPDEAEAAKAGARVPVSSSYLNSDAPAPKRNRKKNATRDWIC
jgi:hypothetical protein